MHTGACAKEKTGGMLDSGFMVWQDIKHVSNLTCCAAQLPLY